MKFIVDELPCGCDDCTFSGIELAPRDNYLCKCKLLDKEEIISDKWCTRLKDCPLRGLRNEMTISIKRYTQWEDVMLRVTVNLGEEVLCEDNTRIGDSGWKDY